MILIATEVSKIDEIAFDEVRTQVANLNTFVQKISGVIVQLFVQNKKYASFQKINKKQKVG